MYFTLWPSLTQTTGAHREIAWENFVSFVSTPSIAAEKTALEGWSPARFRDNVRDGANVEIVSCIVLDDDASKFPTERLVELWSDVAGVVHTSFSHTPAHPKHRIVLRCSRDMTPDEHARVRRHVGALALARGETLDEGTRDAPRFWYVPGYREGAAYAWRELAGSPLDVDAILAAVPAEPLATASAPRELAAPTDRRTAMAAALRASWPSKGRHLAQLALAGALRGEGWTAEDAIDFLEAVAGDRAKREATVRHTWAREAGAPLTGWSTLKAHVDPVVVDAVRAGLGRNAEWNEKTARRLADAGAAQVARVAMPEGLGFEYGAWDAEPPPVAFLVDGLITREGVGMFFGRADTLKTWILFSLGIAVASGKPWLGRFNVQKAKVGIVDYETGAGNVRRRLYMLRAGSDPNLGSKSFAALKPNVPDFWLELAKEGFDLVIVDSLRKANPGANENESGEAIRPLELAAEFSEKTGCAVLFIHHAKKATSDGWPEFRGSGAIEDQVDFAFAVRKIDMSATRKAVEVRCEKPGDMRTPAPFTVEVAFDDAARTATLRHVEPEAEVTDTPTDESSEALQSAIRLALAQGPVPGVKALAKKLTKKDALVGKALALMVERREVLKDGDGYRLDDDAKRRARVLAFVARHGHESRFNTVTRLASAARVAPHDVERLLLEHVIVRAIGTDAGGFVAGSNWPSSPAAPL